MKTQTVARWICRPDIIKRGYTVRGRRLWAGVGKPSEDEMRRIEAACQQLQAEMLDWFYRPKGTKKVRHPNFGGHIYFVRSGDFIKIGFAKDVRQRVGHLQVGSAQPLEILVTFPGTPVDEMLLHRKFRAQRTQGEWFRATPELIAYAHERSRSFSNFERVS